MRLRVVLVVVLLATTGSLAFAQITSATLSGTIKDETGGVLPGVDVVIRNVDTERTRSVVTDANGYFTVPGLAPGKYETRAQAPREVQRVHAHQQAAAGRAAIST